MRSRSKRRRQLPFQRLKFPVPRVKLRLRWFRLPIRFWNAAGEFLLIVARREAGLIAGRDAIADRDAMAGRDDIAGRDAIECPRLPASASELLKMIPAKQLRKMSRFVFIKFAGVLLS